MAKVYIGIGSNIDKHIHIPKILQELQEKYGELKISPIYQTPAIGFKGEDFYNLAVGLQTDLTPQQMYTQLRQLEADHERERDSVNQYISRTLDLDQLLYDDQQINDGKVIIPSPDILEYAFVLKPLADIAADLVHPVLQISMQKLWDQAEFNSVELKQVLLDDEKSVSKVSNK